MRSVRRFSQLALTILGTGIALYAVLRIEPLYDRLLMAALGLLLMQLGVWQITATLMPNQREYLPLRKETDYFLTLVRLMNRAAMAASQGSDFGDQEAARLQQEMHHSVDRMRKLAGLTEEGLGFRYRPRSADARERLVPVSTHREN
ncbi:MAG TPA: hypothetical protein VK939_14495 [Longimicrobiales bacterium]|nr:hypothetical protein [Longimicrobiales bacterium]